MGQSGFATAFQPGPAPQRRSQPAGERNRLCVECHKEIGREWQDSFHRRSYSDPAVQKALQVEPRPFCRGCHAPEADRESPAGGWAAESGVACVTCHLTDDGVHGAPRPGPGRPAPHPVRRDEQMGTSDACARCHEFAFPDGAARVRPELMQSTIAEHRSSAWPERSCISCHMPRVGEDHHRSHRFLGGHDPQLVRRSVQVRAQRVGAAVQVVLSPGAIGHAFPTGDLLRRLAVRVAVVGSDGKEQFGQVRYLGRHFAVAQELPGKRALVTSLDDRLREPTAILLELPPAAALLPIRYQVTYERVLFPGSRVSRAGSPTSDGAALAGEIVLAAGMIAAD